MSEPERGRLRVIDASNVARPEEVGVYNTTGFVLGVAVSGDYGFLARRYMDQMTLMLTGRLEVIDISDPANPRQAASCGLAGVPHAVALSGDYAFVAAEYGGMQVVDISNPVAPMPVAQEEGFAIDLAIVDGRAYIAAESLGLNIVDVSDPTSPHPLGSFDTKGHAKAVAVSGDCAYVADAESGLQILDISTPSVPKWVGGYDTPWSAVGVSVMDHYACVADGYLGLVVLDVSDPANPKRVGVSSAFSANDLIWRNGTIFAAAGGDGLAIAEMLPFFKSISRSSQKVELSWEAFGPTRLQGATDLANPQWEDLTGSESTNAAILPIDNGAKFFRLSSP